jgi:peptidoglycan hydrolase-like protein with peptidoglycan-binding domain
VLSLASADATASAPEPEQGSVDREALYWSSVKDSTDPAVIQSYLDRYPDGEFSVLARAKLASLGAPAETPEVEEPPVTTAAPGSEAFQKAQLADVAGDLSRAARLYQEAADAGHARAMALLGYAYEYGRGVAQSNSQAFDLFSRAAALGDVQGKFSLAWAYDQGKMTTPDHALSGQLFLEVLRSGENTAFYAKIISDFHTGLKPATMKVIQEGLKQDGRYQGAVDGTFGPSTERALKSFGEG